MSPREGSSSVKNKESDGKKRKAKVEENVGK
jgi:hypothetical protein